MANPKVFEFAKEIGMSPLALMDKIKEWQIPVKSHMAELEPMVLEQIKIKLKGGGSADGEKKSTTRTSKKPADKAVAPKATKSASASKASPAGKIAVVKPTTTKSLATAKAAAAAAAATAAATNTTAAIPASHGVGLKSTGTVVRRKATQLQSNSEIADDHEENEETQHHLDEVHVESKFPKRAPEAQVVHTEAPVKIKIQDEYIDDDSEVLQPIELSDEKAQEVVAAKVPPSGAGASYQALASQGTVAPPEVVAPVSAASSGAGPAIAAMPNAVPTSSGGPAAVPPAQVALPPQTAPAEAVPRAAPTVTRKKEVVVGASGVMSNPSIAPSAPRRNIVGRMDLSRVQPPPRPSGGGYQPGGGGGGYVRGAGRPPGAAGTQAGGTTGFRAGITSTFTRPKGNIRPGFVSAPPPMPMGSETDHKRDDRKRTRGGPAPTEGGAAKTPEEEAQVRFDAAEFRKREMVFQPKKKRALLHRPALQTQITTPKASKRVVKVNKTMRVVDLATEMNLKGAELVRALVKNGVMANINTELDFDTIALIVPEFGFEAQSVFKTAEEILVETAFGEMDAAPVYRPPVVTVMGHVDHGKTSLLDAIRSAKVAAGEAGGITQHIGAYQVTLDDGAKITFLDTPGHEAFTAMRARGANVTDIAVIVVAADDGVMPQTAEAISHAKAANVPIIVAINKMDKPGANPERIKQQLTEYQVVPEEWGGDTIFVPVSAIKREGIQELLEQIKVVAEMADLKANPKRSATGTVIEAKLEKGRGPVATLLVKDGTIRVGQLIVAGSVKGKVRSLVSYKGDRIEEATPGMPVEIQGLEDVPQAGDPFDVVESDDIAEQAVQARTENLKKAKSTGKMSLDEIFAKVTQGDVKELVVVLKADVAGSLEAIQGMMQKLGSKEVKLKILHTAIGGISESDVLLASTAKGIVVGFNVRPDNGGQAAAKRLNVDIRTYSIVYELMDDLTKALSGLLTPEIQEKVHGRAEVRNLFVVPKIGTIAGSFIIDGKINRAHMVRLIRDGRIVYEGKIGSLKRFKDDAKEVAQGFECGIGIENFNDLKTGDVIEAYSKEEISRSL